MDPFVENACKERGIHLVKANTDKIPTLKNSFKVDVVPTYLLVDKEGKVIDSKPGA